MSSSANSASGNDSVWRLRNYVILPGVIKIGAMPNKYNPFRPDKMAPPGIFAGRMDEIRFVDHCLLQTKFGNPQHFLFEGERGIGKSSLFLLEYFVATGSVETLETGAKVSFLVLSISLQDSDDYFAIIRKIMGELRRELLNRNSFKAFGLAAWDFITKFEAAGVRYNRETERVEESELFTHLQSDFVKVLNNLGDGVDGILLLIDEADKPSSDAGLGLICKLLTEELSRRKCERLCIGLAGLPNLLEQLKESHESSPRIFKTMTLLPLEPQETKQALEIGLKEASEKNGFAISITEDAGRLICDLAEGYPHFLQEFAYAAFEEDSDNVIDRADVVASLFKENGPFDQLGRKFFAKFYEMPGSDDYRTVLHVMADDMDGWVERATIIQRSGLKAGTVDNALRALKGKNVIVWEGSNRGRYRIPTKAFAVWIRGRRLARQAAGDVFNPTLFGPLDEGK